MQQVAIKILITLVTKLLTERFLGRMVVHTLELLAAKTTNTLDDKLVDDIADALGHPDLKSKKKE